MARGWRVLCADKQCTYGLQFGHWANKCPRRAKESK
jgi:hypothetical protein